MSKLSLCHIRTINLLFIEYILIMVQISTANLSHGLAPTLHSFLNSLQKIFEGHYLIFIIRIAVCFVFSYDLVNTWKVRHRSYPCLWCHLCLGA